MPPLPAYEPRLAAYHRAFAGELRAMIAALPLTPGARVLDMACGDGAYGPWLAERVGPGGEVVGVDISPAYLEVARAAADKAAPATSVGHVAAPIEALPFPDDAFDLAWCAQSFYSLPDPRAALEALRRVVRPGGVVAVLENDSLHHLLFPWPVAVELTLRAAELAAFQARSGRPSKFYVARRLGRVFRAAGFGRFQALTFASDRQAPLGPDARAFFALYLDDLRRRVEPFLADADCTDFRRLVEPDSPDYLLDDPDLTVTCIDHVVWGIKPAV